MLAANEASNVFSGIIGFAHGLLLEYFRTEPTLAQKVAASQERVAAADDVDHAGLVNDDEPERQRVVLVVLESPAVTFSAGGDNDDAFDDVSVEDIKDEEEII